MKRIVIAIDGYSSCGKSTMAKDLAKEVGYVYVDSGAMYRSVTYFCQQKGWIVDGVVNESELAKVINDLKIEFRVNPETGKSDTYLNGENVECEIRSLAVSNQVSIVSAIKFVREAMVAQQQAFSKDKGVVMDGRDIGTTVFPDAELKIFMTADPMIRAQRRADEMVAKGEEVDLQDVLKNLRERDYIDSHREVSPLTQAKDAIVLDNSHMTMEDQMEWLKEIISTRFGS